MKLSGNIIKKLAPYYLLILFVVVVALVVVPAVRDILSLKQQIIAEREKLEESYAKGLSLKKTQMQLSDVLKDVKQIEQSTLQPGQELFLITTLEDIAESKNLEQEIVMDDLPNDVATLTTLPVQVQLTGRFSDILFYIAEIEQQDFYLNWTKVTFRNRNSARGGRSVPNRAPEGASAEETLTAVLDGETFWKP